MKITKIAINKFRGFNNVEFELGSHLTVISGQNGTQKTTLLGLLTQPFTITDKDNPLHGEKPLSGGLYKSAFSEKFKISEKFDIAKKHEWTLFFNDENTPPYTVESISRDKENKTIRFWKKGDRSKSSGYIQLPVIFLSLKRLLPIGEDSKIKEDSSLMLTENEQGFYAKWHNKILIITRDREKIISSSPLLSTNKQTLGANTEYYDWQTNSAGQDNIGKILLAILSFRRLKEKYPNNYKGGILAIDEMDTTFYPGSQIKLLDALNKFAKKYNIQIIFTTHSLTVLKEVSRYREKQDRKNEVKLVYLKKEDQNIIIQSDADYFFIKNHLNRALTRSPAINKIDVYTEDKEATIFVKSLLGTTHTKHLRFIDVSLGCGNLIELSSKKIPSFTFPNSIIILDGDVRNETKKHNKAKRIKNILLLPLAKSPERIVAEFLHKLSDTDSLWKNIDPAYEHENCFQDYSFDDIKKDRKKAKEWFNSQLKYWGRNAFKVLNPWKQKNPKLVTEFQDKFCSLYKEF